jgi:hypothetical protein
MNGAGGSIAKRGERDYNRYNTLNLESEILSIRQRLIV